MGARGAGRRNSSHVQQVGSRGPGICGRLRAVSFDLQACRPALGSDGFAVIVRILEQHVLPFLVVKVAAVVGNNEKIRGGRPV